MDERERDDAREMMEGFHDSEWTPNMNRTWLLRPVQSALRDALDSTRAQVVSHINRLANELTKSQVQAVQDLMFFGYHWGRREGVRTARLWESQIGEREEPPDDMTICPFCGETPWKEGVISVMGYECGHVFAGWDDSENFINPLAGSSMSARGLIKFSGWDDSENFINPLADIELPVLTEWCSEHESCDEILEEACGRLSLLLEAYENGYSETPSEMVFLERLAEIVPEVKSEAYYDTPPGAMVGWEANMLFALEPEVIKARLTQIVVKLSEGFRLCEGRLVDR